MAWKSHDSGTRGDAVPQAVDTVGIVGAGMMGTAIAAVCLRQNLSVVLADTVPEAVASAGSRIVGELVASGLPAPSAEALVGRQVQATGELAAVAACDLVLESIVETLSAKQEVYRRLQPHLGPQTLLASNTSTIPIQRLAAGVANPERFCGLHFFHPVGQRPLVEIIRGPQSSEETIATAVALGKRIDKLPIVVDDGPGFLVNRLLLPYLTEALELLLDGATIQQVEQTALQFGMAKGPLRLLDEIGLDTVFLGGRVLWEAFPERVVVSPLLVSMVKNGLLGRKAGQGFFSYPEVCPGKPPRTALESLLETWRRTPQVLSAEQVAARLVLPMVLEATRMLQEGAVHDPRDVDLAVLLGLGFPAARGGLLSWADALGAARMLELLRPLMPLGPRLAPTELLEQMAGTGRRFYPGREPGQA